jgi:hypothetical protein
MKHDDFSTTSYEQRKEVYPIRCPIPPRNFFLTCTNMIENAAIWVRARLSCYVLTTLNHTIITGKRQRVKHYDCLDTGSLFVGACDYLASFHGTRSTHVDLFPAARIYPS